MCRAVFLVVGVVLALWGQLAECEYSTWHAVDAAMVVCPVLPKPNPLPDGMTDAQWPTTQTFAVNIDYDDGMAIDQPHVVTFFRTDQSRVTITYEVSDANGAQVVPSTSVTLGGSTGSTGSTGRDIDIGSCNCTGSNGRINETLYGAGYGKWCGIWDNPRCSASNEVAQGLGALCCDAWCYTTADCHDSQKSWIIPGAFFSYAGACSGTPDASPCTFTNTKPDPCACINVDNLPTSWKGQNLVSRYGQGYGSSCKPWSIDDCADPSKVRPQDIDTWCCQSWCWVGEECPSKLPSLNFDGLFWSSDKCPDDPALVSQCPFKASTSADAPTNASDDSTCACLGWSPEVLQSGRRRAGKAFPSDYGATCKPHDAQYCNQYFPKLATDIWCCQSWCYVDENCPSANPSTMALGNWWSYEACADDGIVLHDCKFSDVCKPLGITPPALKSTYGSNYGSSCAAWEADNCYTWWGDNDSYWNNDTVGNDWCCQSWAYVNESCPIALWGFDGSALSYSICADTGPQRWDNPSKTCVTRRLEAEDSADDEDGADDAKESEDDDDKDEDDEDGSVQSESQQDYRKEEEDKEELKYYGKQQEQDSDEDESIEQRKEDEDDSDRTPLEQDIPEEWLVRTQLRGLSSTGRRLASRRRTSSTRPQARRRTDSSSSRRRQPTRISDTGRRRSASSPSSTPPARRRQPSNPPANAPARRRTTSNPATDGRRRASNSGGANSVGNDGRRRGATPTPNPTPPSNDGRRRGATPTPPPTPKPTPPSNDGRRRGAPPTPSTPRRRRTPKTTPAPAPANRRRQPTPSRRRQPGGTAAYENSRRRQVDVGGQTYTTPARRRGSTSGGASATDSGRRRTAYGYTNTGTLNNRYNGAPPSKTSYGYSGVGKQSGTATKIMMVGAAVAGGALLGAGAYYAYSRYSSNTKAGDHGVSFQDYSWCKVPSGPQAGRMMRCDDCQSQFGAQCTNQDDCYSSSGCTYTLDKTTYRDDIMTTGFVPARWVGPLTIKITGIVGEAYTQANYCPTLPDSATADGWLQAASISNSLFVTVSEVGNLENVDDDDCFTDTKIQCTWSSNCGSNEQCTDNYCECKPGWCLSSAAGTSNPSCSVREAGVADVSPAQASSSWVLLLCLLTLTFFRRCSY